MRLLFCTLDYFPASTGGAERQARLQAEELVRRGHAVTVVCARSQGLRSGSVDGVFVRRLPRIQHRPFRTISYLAVLGLYLLFKARHYHLLHVHLANLQADVVGFMGALIRRPVYIKVATGGPIGDIQKMSRTVWLTHRFGLRHATYVQAISPEIEAELEGLDLRPGRLLSIPNGFDSSNFKIADESTKRASRERLGLPLDAVVVLFVGRFARYKGVLELSGLWSEPDPPRATLVLLGTGQHTDAFVGEFRPPPSAVVRPFTNEVIDYYHASDIFVLPSHAEGMSNALLEAMACGLAVIATEVGSAGQMIQHDQTGLLYQPGDVDALRSHVRLLVDDPDYRERLGKGAAASTANRYRIGAVVDRILEAYDGATRR